MSSLQRMAKNGEEHQHQSGSSHSTLQYAHSSSKHDVSSLSDHSALPLDTSDASNASYLNLLSLMGGHAAFEGPVQASMTWPQEHSNTSRSSSAAAEGGYQCTVCGKSFPIRYYLTRHMMSHEEKRFQCPYCPTRVCYKWNLKAHVAKVHRDRPPLY